MNVELLREGLEQSVCEALRNLARVARAHVHAGGHDECEPLLDDDVAVLVEDGLAALVREREGNDDREAARALLLGRHFKLEEHVPPVGFEARQVRVVDQRHVA